MKIRIVQVGRTKERALEDFCSELVKRISGFASVEIATVAEAKVSATFSVEKAVAKEGEEILKVLKEGEVLVALDETGKELSSPEFAKFLGKFKDDGRSVCFVIGGPFGLARAVKTRAQSMVSLSKMTFTHQMVRLFLLEQIYRGFCILQGKEYHHE